MLAKTGLLLVTNPNQIGNILSKIQPKIKSTLYIQLVSALTDPSGAPYFSLTNTSPKISQTLFGIYSEAATNCEGLDVRVLLSGIKYKAPQIKTKQPIDLVIFDKKHSDNEIDDFVKTRISNIGKTYSVLTYETSDYNEQVSEGESATFKHTVLGGTFDRLHLAHKLLLSEAILWSNCEVTIGITEEIMLKSKKLWELVEPTDVRIRKVEEFVTDVCSELKYNVVKIDDPYGPAIEDATMEAIIVSKETIRGAEKINDIRKRSDLKELEIISIELVDEPNPDEVVESKISSGTARIRLLGTVINPIRVNNKIPKKPYIIGLTGGIASGKSGVARALGELGAQIIDCDKLAHELYKPGKPAFNVVVETFGQQIVNEQGEINRKALGGIVFSDPKKLQLLNSLLWPVIATEVQNIIKNSTSEVIVVEAAILHQAGWETFCHEVWATFISEEEAVERIMKRNNLTEEQARLRIAAQTPNKYYIRHSHVAFSTSWSYDYTKAIVEKAWHLLQKRIEALQSES